MEIKHNLELLIKINFFDELSDVQWNKISQTPWMVSGLMSHYRVNIHAWLLTFRTTLAPNRGSSKKYRGHVLLEGLNSGKRKLMSGSYSSYLIGRSFILVSMLKKNMNASILSLLVFKNISTYTFYGLVYSGLMP